MLLLCLTGAALTQSGRAQHAEFAAPRRPAATVDWDRAFLDRSGNAPLHFTATYRDAGGNEHRLEEWRVGGAHLRRRTDDRIDLHADRAEHSSGGASEVDWQVIDLQKRIDHRISSAGMLRLGMLYSYYSMAHVLTRPAGAFAVRPVRGLAALRWNGTAARWFELSIAGRPTLRICWDEALGVPLLTLAPGGSGWTENFRLIAADGNVTPASFAVDMRGLQVRDAAQLDED